MKKLVWGFLAALVFTGLFLGYYLLSRNREPTQLQLFKAARREIRLVTSTNGIIEPIDRTDIVAPADGFVVSVPLLEGALVRQGQLIVRLESSQHAAALAQAKAELLRAQVDADPVLSGPRKEELAAIDASIAENSLRASQVASDLRMEEGLLKKQATTRAAVEALQKQYVLLEARSATLKQQREGVVNRYSPEEKQRHLDRITELSKQVDLLEYQIRAGDVTARRGGLLYSVAVRFGSYVAKGQLLGQIYDPGKIQLRAYVDEPDLGRIQKGQQVIIDWDGLPERHWAGKVLMPAEQVVALGNRSVGHVICGIEGDARDLIPNINVKVQIVTARKTAVLVVPRAAVFNRDGHPAVIISDGKETTATAVRLGMSTADEVEILDGLTEGASVVLNPSEALKQ